MCLMCLMCVYVLIAYFNRFRFARYWARGRLQCSRSLHHQQHIVTFLQQERHLLDCSAALYSFQFSLHSLPLSIMGSINCKEYVTSGNNSAANQNKNGRWRRRRLTIANSPLVTISNCQEFLSNYRLFIFFIRKLQSFH